VADGARRNPINSFLSGLRRRRLSVAPDLPDGDRARLAETVEELLAQPETNARRACGERLVEVYTTLTPDGKRRFLELLADRFGPDDATVDAAVSALRAAGSTHARVAAQRTLRHAVTPRYADVLHAVSGLPGGVHCLIDLRADLLSLQRDDPALGLLLDELTGHLATLFDVGLLELRQITWDSPASVLERLIATEAVHAIHGWDELQHRLVRDRCYGFFHPALPNDPIVFVEVALTRGLADDLGGVLERDQTNDDDANTATFYSITSRLPGLAGVHLGNELIKHVVVELQRADDRLQTFATLSPMPRFRAWACVRVDKGELTPHEEESLGTDARAIVTLADTRWLTSASIADRIRPGLLSLAARYLTSTDERGRALDPVANFHLSNGASVERLNWIANPERYGVEESLGLMVNYLYDKSRIAPNATAYLSNGEIRASNKVRNLVKTPKRGTARPA
jgi:malonyl-CoA decarboxylase